MNFELSDGEVRVLGSLIEKKITTPEYYPLTLNSLVNACNQKSNREPVVTYTEIEVQKLIDVLRSKRFVRMVEAGGRVPKYKESFTEELNFDASQTAALCVLMLRGPQTAAEIRNRSGRLHEFAVIEEVEDTLNNLTLREDGPFVVKLEKQPGMKERRYAHLFSGIPEFIEKKPIEAGEERLAKMESEIEYLKSEIEALKITVDELRRVIE